MNDDADANPQQMPTNDELTEMRRRSGEIGRQDPVSNWLAGGTQKVGWIPFPGSLSQSNISINDDQQAQHSAQVNNNDHSSHCHDAFRHHDWSPVFSRGLEPCLCFHASDHSHGTFVMPHGGAQSASWLHDEFLCSDTAHPARFSPRPPSLPLLLVSCHS